MDPAVQLEAAHALLTAGCLDCLSEAHARYEKLRPDPTVGAAAMAGIVRSAVLIAIREHELGLLPGEHLAGARAALPPLAPAELTMLIDIADAIVSGPSGPMRTVTLEAQTLALVNLSRNQGRWAEALRARMPDDRAAVYLWLSLACGIYGSQIPESSDRAAAVGDSLRVPVVGFKDAVACSRNRADALQAVLKAEARFQEVHFFLGLAALSGQPRAGAPAGPPDLEAADAEFRAAYDWRQDWPSLTLVIANLALTFEDFARAFEFFDRTLQLLPSHPEALLGKVRALTYLQRHPEAIAVTDELLATGLNPGEARYWRALNEEQLDQHDLAWDDVEIADRLLFNADVPKLAGIISINRHQLDVARQKLEVSLKRRSTDCEVRYYLQIVLSEQRDWVRAAAEAASCAACFDREETTLRDEIERFRSSKVPPVRRDRQIARRERQIAANARMRATAWFNAAAASFNLGKREEAQAFAQRLTEDEQFAGRAQELLQRLGQAPAIRN